MKNYWLERRKNKGFDYIVAQYQNGVSRISANKFALALYELAGKSVDYINRHSVINIDREDAIQECVMLGFDKVSRYKPTKDSKAYNFFITCMLGHLRQIFRTKKNYQELKEHYKRFLKSNEGQITPDPTKSIDFN